MEDVAKYFLLILLVLPYAALFTDAIGKTKALMLKTVIPVAVLSAVIAFGMGGFHQRPNVASIYSWSFLFWPVCLILAKQFQDSISWRSMWISVPIMSWYLVNLSMQFWYPTNSGGGGFGAYFGLVLGWFYMVIPFGILSGLFVLFKKLLIKRRASL